MICMTKTKSFRLMRMQMKCPMQGPGLEQNCRENQFFWVSNFTYNHSLKTKRKERNILSKTKFRAY